MNLPNQSDKAFIGKSSAFAAVLFFTFAPIVKASMTIGGPITAHNVIVTGDVSVSTMSVSTLTVTNQLNFSGTAWNANLSGRVLQVKFSTAGPTSISFTSTFSAVPGLSQTISLSSSTNYVRISLTGSILPDIDDSSYVTIFRDGTTNLGSADGLSSSGGFFFGSGSCGIVITDSPGDTSSHTYQAFVRHSDNFPYDSVAYLIVEEIGR